MNRTDIEYLTHSWSPIAMRCTPTSAGCSRCWHLRMANRLAGMEQFSDEVRAAYAGEGPPVLEEDRLEQALKRKKPSIIGTQFMGDLFAKGISFSMIREVFLTMAKARQHTFLLLTKRPKRMQEFTIELLDSMPHNVIPGVTAENQQAADERIPLLLETPAAKRWVSLEPMLGPIDLTGLQDEALDALNEVEYYVAPDPKDGSPMQARAQAPALSLVVLGTESGPNRRPAKIEWMRDVVEQCREAGVPVFTKQVEINGRVSHDPQEWPEELRVRQMPEGER